MKNIFACVVALLLLAGCQSARPLFATPEVDLPEAQAKSAALVNVQLAMGYLKQGERTRANLKLNKAFSYAPTLPEVHMGYALLFDSNGEMKKASDSYQEALRLAPKSGVVHNNYGVFLCKHRRFHNAITHFEIALEDPNYTTLADAYENAGLCAEKIPARQQALEYYKKAIAHSSQRPKSLLGLARINYQLQRYKEAKQSLEAFLTLQKNNPETLLLGARLAERNADRGVLESIAKEMQEHFPESAEAKKLARMVRTDGR